MSVEESSVNLDDLKIATVERACSGDSCGCGGGDLCTCDRGIILKVVISPWLSSSTAMITSVGASFNPGDAIKIERAKVDGTQEWLLVPGKRRGSVNFRNRDTGMYMGTAGGQAESGTLISVQDAEFATDFTLGNTSSPPFRKVLFLTSNTKLVLEYRGGGVNDGTDVLLAPAQPTPPTYHIWNVYIL